MNILVVDDQPAIVSILMERLAERGYRVWGLTKGAQVESWILTHAVDVVIIDIRLRDVDGLTLIQHLAATGMAKIIAMSGSTDDMTRQNALDCGANDFLPKPIPFNVLLDLLPKSNAASAI